MNLAGDIGYGLLGAVGLAAGLVLGVLIVAALAVTARGFLGVRVGVVRTMDAGGLGYVVAGLVAAAITPALRGRKVLAPSLVFVPPGNIIFLDEGRLGCSTSARSAGSTRFCAQRSAVSS